MRLTWLSVLALALSAGIPALGEAPVEVRVRQTAAGPQLEVNGKAVRPRFYYGSPTCLCNIASQRDVCFNYPFLATENTDNGRVDLEVYPGEGPMDWKAAELVDVTTSTTNRFAGSLHAKHYFKAGLQLQKGHVYRFRVITHADHSRTYYTYKVGYTDAAGHYHPLPFPYGDTLGDTARLAADSGVDIVTFSTDSSWGCEKWWWENLDEKGFRRIDEMMEHLIRINPRSLLMPRVTANAPDWFLERHPEAKMKFHRGFTIGMSSISYRPYRQAACEAVERLARHLYVKFPRNFAGLHVSGQNSAEWFYMMSQSDELSGYDAGTKDAFREYLRKQGASDWSTAEVPTPEARRVQREGHLFDPRQDARVLDFIRLRNLEMATLLADIGAAVRRGTDGKKLSVFFYGYSWELGSLGAGAGESGHYAMQWLLDNAADKVDGISAPMSYRCRNLTGYPSVMSAAETVTRRGILWINEVDDRTHREEIWDHMALFTPYTDPWPTEQVLKRNSLHCILRGYGDWWMDLFGRGWHNERGLWKVRRDLNAIDDAMLKRRSVYSPEVAVVLDEPSMQRNGWLSNSRMRGLVNRMGFAGSGTTYGQYLLADYVKSVPPAKLVYLVECHSPVPEVQARLAAVRKARADIVFVENPAAEELTSAAIAARAKEAGCHVYTAPEQAAVEAAERYVMIQSRVEGDLKVDFGADGPICDAFSGKALGTGPVLTLPFRKGEVRVFSTIKK